MACIVLVNRANTQVQGWICDKIVTHSKIHAHSNLSFIINTSPWLQVDFPIFQIKTLPYIQSGVSWYIDIAMPSSTIH